MMKTLLIFVFICGLMDWTRAAVFFHTKPRFREPTEDVQIKVRIWREFQNEDLRWEIQSMSFSQPTLNEEIPVNLLGLTRLKNTIMKLWQEVLEQEDEDDIPLDLVPRCMPIGFLYQRIDCVPLKPMYQQHRQRPIQH